MAKNYTSLSPHSYSANNPQRIIDIMGMALRDKITKKHITGVNNYRSYCINLAFSVFSGRGDLNIGFEHYRSSGRDIWNQIIGVRYNDGSTIAGEKTIEINKLYLRNV